MEFPRFIGRDGEPMSLEEWSAKLPDMEYRRIASNVVRGYWISTVWLGLDHNFGFGRRAIYETMIFAPGDESEGESIMSGQYQDRYATEDEAIAGHEAAIRWICEELGADITKEVTTPIAADAKFVWDSPETHAIRPAENGEKPEKL